MVGFEACFPWRWPLKHCCSNPGFLTNSLGGRKPKSNTGPQKTCVGFYFLFATLGKSFNLSGPPFVTWKTRIMSVAALLGFCWGSEMGSCAFAQCRGLWGLVTGGRSTDLGEAGSAGERDVCSSAVQLILHLPRRPARAAGALQGRGAAEPHRQLPEGARLGRGRRASAGQLPVTPAGQAA